MVFNVTVVIGKWRQMPPGRAERSVELWNVLARLMMSTLTLIVNDDIVVIHDHRIALPDA